MWFHDQMNGTDEDCGWKEKISEDHVTWLPGKSQFVVIGLEDVLQNDW